MARNIIFARIFEPIFTIVAMQGVEALLLRRRHQNNNVGTETVITEGPTVVRQSQMQSYCAIIVPENLFSAGFQSFGWAVVAVMSGGCSNKWFNHGIRTLQWHRLRCTLLSDSGLQKVTARQPEQCVNLVDQADHLVGSFWEIWISWSVILNRQCAAAPWVIAVRTHCIFNKKIV